MSFEPYDVTALLKEVQNNGKHLESEEGRRRCFEAAASLVRALETPREAVMRLLYAEQTHLAAIRTGIQMGLFKSLDDGNGNCVSTTELAKSTHADPQLLARLLKHLAAMGTIYESGSDKFLPTRLSKALTDTKYSDGFPVLQEVVVPPISKLHLYLQKHKYQDPQDAMDSPFQFGTATTDHYWTWMQEHPKLYQMFNNHMTATHAGLSSWMDDHAFPFAVNLLEGASTETDAVFFVDIGGGNGHDVSELCRRHPEISNRMVLQDQANVVENVKSLDPRIEVMGHNFFEEQPIKGARAYFMHRVLHDWPDDKCRDILAKTKVAMTKGYSKLLLNEMVVPDTGAPGNSTGIDLLMMSLFSARERTEQGWRTLLDGAGLRIVKIWHVQAEAESLIEAEIA